MSEFYCLDIEFPDFDFSTYDIKRKEEVDKIYHAHLFLRTDKIEIRIFYDESSNFCKNFDTWTKSIDYKKFGSFLKVSLTNNNTNERLQKIDLSESKLCGFSGGFSDSSDYYEDNKKYIVVKIDTVKFYLKPNQENVNTAEFYLDDKGFRVVAPFYSILRSKTFFKNDGKFEINRMNDSKQYYKLKDSTFRPEFNFYSTDNKKDRIAKIMKEPKIQFKYQKGISEKKAIFYGEVVLMLASFYHHIKIDYIFRRIHLTESTIEIRNIEQKNYFNTMGTLWGFKISWNFNQFLQSSWQKETLKNFELLSKAVTLFNQSLLVDDSAAFLIRYNIIEICDKTSVEKGIWNFKLKNDELDNFFSDMGDRISNIIDEGEQEDFQNKWNSIQNIIKSKSLRKQLEDSLTKNDINCKSLPIPSSEIVQLRNNITHGSLDKINIEDLIKANILLYRISGILILNLMGINDWVLYTKIN